MKNFWLYICVVQMMAISLIMLVSPSHRPGFIRGVQSVILRNELEPAIPDVPYPSPEVVGAKGDALWCGMKKANRWVYWTARPMPDGYPICFAMDAPE